MSSINYVVGDATKPRSIRTILMHGTNSCGKWGSGFVLAVDKLSPFPKNEYRKWFQETICYAKDEGCIVDNTNGTYEIPFMLGEIQVVPIRPGLAVANMITQKDVGMFGHLIPFRYDSFRECLYRLSKACKINKCMHVTGPRVGAGLACADWNNIEPIIIEELVNRGIDVDIYDLPKGK